MSLALIRSHRKHLTDHPVDRAGMSEAVVSTSGAEGSIGKTTFSAGVYYSDVSEDLRPFFVAYTQVKVELSELSSHRCEQFIV